jgi:CubicO group peptidase (beta-lactamase class C family)
MSRLTALPKLLLLASLMLTGARGAGAQVVPSSYRGPEIQAAVAAWRTRVGLPAGLAVGVTVRGKRVYRGRFGTARYGEQVGVDDRTIFHMASLTKPFVATAVMQLVEQGKVVIDSPVTRYLPYFRMNDPRAASITVKELLNHTSGMPDVTDYRWDHPEYDDGSLERYVRGLADSMLVFDPGTRYRYSNIGFEVLADLIANVSGEPFEEYLQRHILTPLGMRHSTLLMTDVDSAHLALGTIRDSSGAIIRSPHYPYNRPHAASSTLHSNVEDMLRWGNLWLRGGELKGHRIISAATARQMTTVTFDRTEEVRAGWARDHQTMPYDSIGIGLSWFISTKEGKKTIFHRGGDVGFRSLLSITPDDSTVIVIMANNSVVGDLQELAGIIEGVLQQARR